jgi:hypothetical protein
MVDIKLKFEEQNRNQISFARRGVVRSFDGFLRPAVVPRRRTFLGRGETLGLNLQKGFPGPAVSGVVQRAVLHAIGPSRSAQTVYGAPVSSTTSPVHAGLGRHQPGSSVNPLSDFVRMFATYSYETIRV